jgi:hypothetical protein
MVPNRQSQIGQYMFHYHMDHPHQQGSTLKQDKFQT